MSEKVCLLLVLGIALGGFVLVLSQNASDSARMRPPVDDEETADDFIDMTVDIAGVEQPQSVMADEAELADDELVVGLTLGDEHRAYRLSAMKAPAVPLEGGPEMQAIGKHVVNDALGGAALSVTHCDRSNYTHVYRRDGPSEAGMRIGGWQRGKMLLLHRGRRFEQDGHSAPVPTVPHVITSWNDWRAEHPDTTVYVGE